MWLNFVILGTVYIRDEGVPIMRRLSFIFLLIALIVSRCQGEQDTIQNDATNDQNSVIQWPEQSSHVIFQADEINIISEDTTSQARDIAIPACTIYGDGRVIWKVSADDPLNSVLIGPVDPPRIRAFVNALVLDDIYNKTQLAPDGAFNVQTLRLFVNDVDHRADAYGSWTNEFYQDILEQCKTLSPRPQIYRPDALWLYVYEQEYDPNISSILWEAEVTGVDLAAIADQGQPSWIEGRVVHLIWAYQMRASNHLQYSQGDRNFMIAIEIPNVTRTSPPAP